jgi:ribosomal protein S18 acetylase RimI-like enzyme
MTPPEKFRIRDVSSDSCGRAIRFLLTGDENTDLPLPGSRIPGNSGLPFFVAESLPAGRIVGAARPSRFSHGLAGVDFRIDPAAADGVVAGLFNQIEGFCRANRIDLIQCMVPVDNSSQIKALTSVGFRAACEVHGRLLPLSNRLAPCVHSGLSFVALADDASPRLRRILDRTYADSRDCPEFDDLKQSSRAFEMHPGIRMDEHSASFVVGFQEADIGCVLLSHDEKKSEIVYFGIVPESRGKQLGDAIVSFAINWAIDQGSHWLVAYVDSANVPALRIYDRFEFLVFDRQAVLLRSLPSDGLLENAGA